ETYLEALAAAMFAGRLALPGGTMLDVAMSVKAGLHPSPANGLELLLEAIATLITESFEAFVPMLHRSFRAFDAGGMPVDEQVRWKWLPTIFSAHVWDDFSWLAICAPPEGRWTGRFEEKRGDEELDDKGNRRPAHA